MEGDSLGGSADPPMYNPDILPLRKIDPPRPPAGAAVCCALNFQTTITIIKQNNFKLI